MKCPHCGQENKDTYLSCWNCQSGLRLAPAPSSGGVRCAAHGSEIVAEAFNSGFKAALTKVKPSMRCLEVLTVKADAWIEFAKAQSQNGELADSLRPNLDKHPTT